MSEQTTAPEVPAETWAKLAAPFDATWIEKLPKQLKRGDDNRGRCEDTQAGRYYSADGHYCGGWHARSVHLDYIGHAGITMRLNDVVGPAGWTLEPLATTEDGLPLMRGGEFWAKLTILGVTHVDLAAFYNTTQEAWGDALRRCAMRFGIGTYLWAKSEFAAELAAHKDPLPGEDPAELAQADATRLESYAGPANVLDGVLAHARERNYSEAPVKFRGNTMTLEGAIALVRVELTEAAEKAAAQAAQEAASAPQTAPEAPAQPTAPAPAGETPQDAAYDLAREALVTRTTDGLAALWRATTEAERALDVLPVLGDDDLAAIDAPRDLETMALGALLMAANRYVTKHGAAIRDLGEPLPERKAERRTSVDPDDPWATDAAAGWPDKNTPAP